MKIKTLRRVEFVGNIATGAMTVLVIQTAGWKWFLIWLPLLLLIEFGCFAHRDIKWKMKEDSPERHVCELCDGTCEHRIDTPTVAGIEMEKGRVSTR